MVTFLDPFLAVGVVTITLVIEVELGAIKLFIAFTTFIDFSLS